MILETNSFFKQKILKKEPVFFFRKLYDDDLKRIRDFYQKEGYLDIDFGTPIIKVNKKNKVELILFIVERTPITISEVSFTIDSLPTLDEAVPVREKRNIELQSETTESKVFRDEALQHDKLLIAEEFFNLGYPYTLVTHKLVVDTLAHTTEVKWIIDKGVLAHFGKTTVVGNKNVPTKSIMRNLNYKEGEVWSKKKIEQSQKYIYNQGIYRVASIKTQITDERLDTLPMQIRIDEAPRWTIRFGAGYGREDKFRAFSDIQYLRFLTHTGRLNFYVKHSYLEPYNIYLKFSQPSFLFPINTLSLHPFILGQNEPGFRLRRGGFNVTMQQNFSKELNTSIGFVFEDVQMDTTGNEEANISVIPESFYEKSGLVIGGIYNNSEPILDPVQGYVISLNMKNNALLFSDEMPFFRILAEYKTYIGLRKGVVLALKIKGGGIARTDDETFIPVEEQFFAGGSHSVRGWARSELGPKNEDGVPIGGNSLFETSAELRIGVGRRFTLALFTDAGNVWLDSFSYKLNDLHYAAGAGLRINTPIGPAGLDFARPVFEENLGWQVHFNIGHTF